MSTSATYTHLRDGSWGIRVPGTARENQSITVAKKSGDKKTEIVAKVLWTGRDSKTSQTISLCAIAGGNGQAGASAGHGARTCADCGGPVRGSYRYCYECGMEHRDGGSRAAGGQSYYDRNGNFVLGDDD
jgi:hypothetical protein